MSSTWSARRRRPSSASARGRSMSVVEAAADLDGTIPSGTARTKPRAPSTSVLSSSYNLPSRSYIHHAGHGKSDTLQYSSSGVREQTADLSSSFLTESDNATYSSFELPDPIVTPNSTVRRHEPIEERSEPVSPDGYPSATHRSSNPLDATQPGSPFAGATASMLLHEPSTTSDKRPSLSATGDLQTASISTAVIEDDDATETSPLLPRARLSSARKADYDTVAGADGDDDDNEIPVGKWNHLGHHYPSKKKIWRRLRSTLLSPSTWTARELLDATILRPASMLPAVFLGLLLNLLDALSYGIILFPLGEEIFADMGPDGVSMFYVSCIVSQITYSTGSIFRGGVGSEMIEVVPFFHKMTYTIMAEMGTDNPDAVRATVITSYCMSSIITGVVFFALGSANLGTLVNFFPHSILTGCIGGVGIFLFITGIEVSARMEGGLELTIETFQRLFATDNIVLWLPPLFLAILLLTIKHFYDRAWLVPAYYIGITALFYIVTTAVPSIHMDDLRSAGWVFEAPAVGVPFYNFYSYFRFDLVNWDALISTIPSQLALTFFGILHVPINVPNLAMVVQEDNVSINRELIMHGISNTLSGCVGSIQNYLVFVNSVLFMNTGADSRLAGYMLALATFGLWVAGPVVIGYVPVMVVGTLIYMLGIDLTMEAVVATYGRLGRLEYATIIVIAAVMGLYDFVVGIGIGIGLACLVYVVQTSRKTVIRAEFSGEVAESTVRRHPRQRAYLHRVGPQTRVVKLGGYLFFGSIVRVEKKVRALVDAEAFAASPIRYLILDFSHVTGIDFSAAEAFNRMNRILHRREVTLMLAGVSLENEVGRSLSMVGLFVENEEDPSIPAPKVFETLNGALESCENDLLIILSEKQRSAQRTYESPPMAVPEGGKLSISALDDVAGSPRHDQLQRAASTTITEADTSAHSKWHRLKQPLPLILQTFQDLTSENEDFWFRALPYFTRRNIHKGQLVYSRGDRPDGFYLLQSGLLRAEYFLEQGNYHESIVAGTTCGELPFFSDTVRTSTVVAELESVAWCLSPEKWSVLQREDAEVSRELLKVGLKLSAERMNAITSYVLITAS